MTRKGDQYYGGYFWLAVISFMVPLIVAWKAFDNIQPTPAPDVSGVDNAIWDYLLKSYVANGLIDYDGMKKDYLFREYLRQLGSAKPDALPTVEARLALACNAYNAFVINGVVIHRISDSVSGYEVEGTGFFDLREHIYAGQTISLNDLEHQMIRPTFKEPRIHVALVCAARSCPAIRGEAYTGEQLDRQLEDQSVQFANNPKYVKFDADTNELWLSRILSWYGEDWDQQSPNGGYLRWVNGLVTDESMKSATKRAITGDVTVKFLDYDWTLNSQAEPGSRSGSKTSGGFGSGSIPDE